MLLVAVQFLYFFKTSTYILSLAGFPGILLTLKAGKSRAISEYEYFLCVKWRKMAQTFEDFPVLHIRVCDLDFPSRP